MGEGLHTASKSFNIIDGRAARAAGIGVTTADSDDTRRPSMSPPLTGKGAFLFYDTRTVTYMQGASLLFD